MSSSNTTEPKPSPSSAPISEDQVDDEVTKVDKTPVIDMETFNQLQEMDDDEDEREFSRGIVWTYFEQVPEKLDEMGDSLKTKDYLTVSQVAHFLKGSSAALGVARVSSLFETIQLQAKDVYKAVKASRLDKSTTSSPKFDEDSAELTPEQLEILEAAKEEALAAEEKRVKLLEKAYEKVRGEYVIAEEWLRNEYGESDSEDEDEEEDE
ncbi:Two-component phosphorelay intermediate involved in MAP kinase cascade regulation [Phaffia rhodozyma]|uniref:Two-component phosphorelay intermediate involved in MAP kinase cascade regulation n=1 Tax=Phaffia rhodozyma TaxID=264483 RepID=A0A0F7SV62_PHARH|nr:Two-component phosphorelay intermediate involved in MAP kinase cascade regulation [Phaffia rhodozyma]